MKWDNSFLQFWARRCCLCPGSGGGPWVAVTGILWQPLLVFGWASQAHPQVIPARSIRATFLPPLTAQRHSELTPLPSYPVSIHHPALFFVCPAPGPSIRLMKSLPTALPVLQVFWSFWPNTLCVSHGSLGRRWRKPQAASAVASGSPSVLGLDMQTWKLRAVGDLQANQASPCFTTRELRSRWSDLPRGHVACYVESPSHLISSSLCLSRFTPLLGVSGETVNINVHGDLPDPGITPVSPALQADSLPSEPT